VNGKDVRVLLDSDESNLLSLATDARGAVYVGGDSRGRVFRVAPDGTLRTVFDAAEDEVRALALGSDGALYAAALTAAAVSEEGEPAGSDRPRSRAR
jgi:sugar lactone lactonase YvrE